MVTDPQSTAKTTIKDVNGWFRQAKDAYGYTLTLSYDAPGSAGRTLKASPSPRLTMPYPGD